MGRRRIEMAAWKDRYTDLPYLHQPGYCPRCGQQLRPLAEQVVAGGEWSTSDGRGGIMTTGHLFTCKCPGCEMPLLSFPLGWPNWQEVDPARVQWYPNEELP
jgi:hypothetical protein